jgi:deoxyadenosine/deoxycytidine kinase
MQSPCQRIEICGGIAAGKTTLASLMKSYNFEVIFESFKQNPFWESFYINPGKWIFEAEITFTLLHYHQIKMCVEMASNIVVCDFSLNLDCAYAKIGLSGSQLEAFERVYLEVHKELGLPILLVHLRCDAATELARIRARGRSEESSINVDFLDSLNKAVEMEVSAIQAECPVITIDSAIKDFANDENIKKEMVNLIQGQIQEIQKMQVSVS